MTNISQQIGHAIYEEVVSKGLETIENGLREAPTNESDELVVFFNQLSPHDKSLFLRTLRAAFTDATSNVLGIIDGTSPLGPDGEYLDLSIRTESEEISDLQDYFLEADEAKNKSPIGLIRHPSIRA